MQAGQRGKGEWCRYVFDVMEGSIVRAVVRLDQACRLVWEGQGREGKGRRGSGEMRGQCASGGKGERRVEQVCHGEFYREGGGAPGPGLQVSAREWLGGGGGIGGKGPACQCLALRVVLRLDTVLCTTPLLNLHIAAAPVPQPQCQPRPALTLTTLNPRWIAGSLELEPHAFPPH